MTPSSSRGSRRVLATRLTALVIAGTLVAAGCGREEDDAAEDKPSTATETSGADGATDEGDAPAAFINPDDDCTNYEGTKGITGDTIKIGTVRPATGPYSIFDKVTSGLQGWVDSTNSKGGVKAGDGKTYKLELVKEDDAYDPAKTPGLVKKLVEQDGVFAIVGQIGTSNNLAVRDYMNENCIPSIALATGSTEWGKANEYPWFIGGLPSYATEAHAFAEYLKETKPTATVALLYQDDDFGQAYQKTLKKEIEGTEITIVAEQPFNPLTETSTESKVAQLASSKADVFFVGIGGTPCPRTLTFMPADWTPMTYVSLTCASKTAMSLAGGKDEGVFSTQATLDPSGATDQANPRVQAFLTDGAAAGISADDLQGGIAVIGWNFGAMFGELLAQSPEVSRAGVMNTAYSLDGVNFGLLRDEVSATTNGDEDPWALEDLRIVKRTGGEWVEVTPMTSYAGKSNSFEGK